MSPTNRFGAEGDSNFQVLWEDGDRVFCRTWRPGADGDPYAVLAVLPAAEHPAPATLDRLAHEYALKDELDGPWAVRPLAFVRDPGQTMLVLEDPASQPLAQRLGAPMAMEDFLPLAIAIAGALAQVHRRGLVHKDIKPANILAHPASGEIKLTGFGIASRLPRERQAPEPPESIAGTLAYMAPEQTGRMNRSINSRSDLYALGVTFYQMLTGALPFTAADPMEWVHCHIARQPAAPADRVEDIPGPVSAIVMKLLAKTAEDRYQTASGLENDLRHCLAGWQARHRIDAFPLGEHDGSDRLIMPEKLYGRAREVETLLATFDRVVKSGTPELVLVSGYSGIGKSSVVNELHKALVPRRGLFASGKFDQHKRNIPYATLAQAFQSLVRSLLSQSDAALAPWRDALVEALGPNGQLIVDLVPELRLIIGDQPPVPELEPQQMQRRFQLVVRRFIGVFARPAHPLALFLDDLQWLDAATLDLLEDVLTQPDLRYLLLIGAYRDNEVTASHPLTRKLDAIKSAGGKVMEITLAPLALEHIGQLIADALRCEPARAAPLAQLVHEKTGGNPFFAIQFLFSLAEEGMLTFDHDAARWSWDLERIHAKRYTDNVVELMVGKLTRLPGETQKALQQMACLGNTAETTKLSIILETSEEQVHAVLWEAVRQEFVVRLASAYQFIHDRVQEAAYSLFLNERRAEVHLRIGRLLAAHTPPEKREEAAFDIVDQLNRGAALIHEQAEREQLAEFNLLAGKRAKASTAYASALNYLAAGATLLAENSWERRHKLTFALELERAECEFLTGALAEAEQRLAELACRAATLPDLAAVTQLRVELFIAAGRSDRAVEAGLDYLHRVGLTWAAHPTQEEVRQEYTRIWRQLGDRPIEGLMDLPRMAEPIACATMDILTALAPPALHTDENLLCLVFCRMTNLSLEHGNSDASCHAYVLLGAVLGPYFGNYEAGYRFGQLGLDLVERRGLGRSKAARADMVFGSHVNLWTRHVRTGRPLLQRAFDEAQQAGDLTYAAYSRTHLITNLLASGDPLGEVQREAEAGLDFARQARFGLIVDRITGQLQLIRMLRGLTPKFGCFDEAGFDEGQFEQRLETNPSLAIAACWYWIRKLQARVFAGDHTAAVAAAAKAERHLWTSPAVFERAEYHFYAALAHAALCDTTPTPERSRHLEVLADHHRQLQVWAKNCPENFENGAVLVGAEIARIEGRDVDAMHLYERAIRSARENGFVHNEALAYELAARFYAARGFEKIAQVYLRDARYGYLRWGAEGKVRQLDQLYPHLREKERAPATTSTIGAPVEQLDLATVIKVSQTVSGEIVLEKLLDTLLRTALEHAGAERGLLVMARGAETRIAAEASIDSGTVAVRLCDAPMTAAMLPEAVLNYVLHTRESIVLDDAAVQDPFATDPYNRQHQARSMLALPLLTQAKLIGALYLENNLAPGVFAPARIAVLKLLASQAAIALENTRLYREVAEREAKIRRLIDANIIGIFIANVDGRIFEANDAFLQMVGYDREDLLSGRIRWTDLTPPEWRERDALVLETSKTTGTILPYEKQYFRKDGSRVWVLIGGASFEKGGDEGVIFVLDLTERKRTEEALGKVQMELAHANRVATMGQLTSSIAHEVSQPIAATIMSAQAALNWLAAEPPALEEARRSLKNVVRDGNRARDVIDQLRALIKKAPPRKDRLDINEAIREVIEVTRGEVMKHGISVQTCLAEGLPLIEGDRVQLQQVILNLIINAVQAMSGMSEGPRELLISTGSNETNGALVAVQDSGPGIAPETHGHLFEAFYTTKAGGLGLGLSICRSIIEAHGGRLWASANVPHGAVFHFAVPAGPDGV